MFSSIFNRIKEETFGEFIVDCLCVVLRKLLDFKALRGLTLVPADAGIPTKVDVDGLKACAKSGDELLKLVDPDLGLPQQFVDEAIRKGDWCFAFYDQNRPVSYGWYSEKPTYIDPEHALYFSSDYLYMYKGFTEEKYRGKRLHGIGMKAAAHIASQRGKRGLISFVAANNFRSLRSCRRIGYKIFGTVFVFRLFGHGFTFRTPGCRDFDFLVQKGERLVGQGQGEEMGSFYPDKSISS